MNKSKSANKIVCQQFGCGSMDLLDITKLDHSKKEFLCKNCSSQFSIDFFDYLSTKYGKVEELSGARLANIKGLTFEFKITEGFINSTENILAFMADAKSISGETYTKVKKFITDKNFCHLVLST